MPATLLGSRHRNGGERHVFHPYGQIKGGLAQRREGAEEKQNQSQASSRQGAKARRKIERKLCSRILPCSASLRLCASKLVTGSSFAPLRLDESWFAFDFDSDNDFSSSRAGVFPSRPGGG